MIWKSPSAPARDRAVATKRDSRRISESSNRGSTALLVAAACTSVQYARGNAIRHTSSSAVEAAWPVDAGCARNWLKRVETMAEAVA
jgi:hypothetical protein